MAVTIELLAPQPTPTEIDQLAELLHTVVHGGASVSFITPFSIGDASQWWRSKVLPQHASGLRHVLVARVDGRIVGSVQLILDMPPNQQHRADVAKLLVHPEVRRQGIARSLMNAIEQLAVQHNRTLLVLDTVTGSAADPLYRSLGYQLAGIIPDYARQALTPTLESTSIFYKYPQAML